MGAFGRSGDHAGQITAHTKLGAVDNSTAVKMLSVNASE
jgi:hypothetical protein